ncbi:ABC transporter B family protein [Tieghemostelium lacteum]|uniref:ABC transporter B family protein n=1 Tax=Tieghemostelium lacteum TaxID=361077 RepID=A0A151ZHW2_TIELA|nr:ABC transporter B family protein [Tieghemostelium lacteum]|eukprot:KYQ93460.1 ABC transporter B family protein [Tieghemostelium lacteum]
MEVKQRVILPDSKKQIKESQINSIKGNVYGSTTPLALFSSSAKTLTKKEELHLKRPSWEMITSLWRTLFPYLWSKNSNSIKIRVILSISSVFLWKLLNLLVPVIYKNIIDQLPNSMPWQWLLCYGVLVLVQKNIWDFRDIVYQPVTDNALRNVNLETFDKVHSLGLSYHLSKKSGSLLKTTEKGSYAVVDLMHVILFDTLPTFIEIIMVTVFLWCSYGYTFACINVFSVLVYSVFTFMITEWRNQFRRIANYKEGQSTDIRSDSFTNFETLKYFTAESFERHRYDIALLDYYSTNMKAKWTYILASMGQASIAAVGTVVALTFATWKATGNNQFSIGDLVAINTLIMQVFEPLQWIGSSYRMIMKQFTDMENLVDLLNLKPEISDIPDAQDLDLSDSNGDTILPSIHFNNVSFSYKTETATVKILDGVSFRVEPGKSVALVGPTGAGKSTVFRLLCRFYDVDDGEVLVENQNIKNITQLSLRQAIGVVPQDTVLFNDTIAYNIGFGKREATDEELIDAARRAQILPFIESSPDGFLTLVGERGLRLSGGEKQRVAIARTLLKNPPILILDEATSALDSLTEKKIQQSLNEVSKGRTTLIIAHRLSTIIHCDEILVLKNGIIAERGTHNQLLSIQGEYANLWNQQLNSPDNINKEEDDE